MTIEIENSMLRNNMFSDHNLRSLANDPESPIFWHGNLENKSKFAYRLVCHLACSVGM
jgi:hypothetical protein